MVKISIVSQLAFGLDVQDKRGDEECLEIFPYTVPLTGASLIKELEMKYQVSVADVVALLPSDSQVTTKLSKSRHCHNQMEWRDVTWEKLRRITMIDLS